MPTQSVVKQIEVYLNNIFPIEKKVYEFTDDIEFIDPGSNFEKINCNLCGKNIDIDTWQEEMDTAFEKDFSELSFTTSCCQRENNLNDLEYLGPAGFAKFVINIADSKRDISNDELTALEQILGVKVRKIWAHY